MSNIPRFISEKEIAEKKAKDAAEGKIEEPYDPRSLYDRLQVIGFYSWSYRSRPNALGSRRNMNLKMHLKIKYIG